MIGHISANQRLGEDKRTFNLDIACLLRGMVVLHAPTLMNVQSLGNKLDCVIDHITDNRIDIVGITETWLSNDDKNNMSVVNTCLNNGYTPTPPPQKHW